MLIPTASSGQNIAAAAGITAPTFIESTGWVEGRNSDLVFNTPASSQAGDVYVVVIYDDQANPGVVVPGTWTTQQSANNGSRVAHVVATITRGASEPTFNFGTIPVALAYGNLLVFRGVSAVNALGSPDQDLATTSISTASQNTTQDNSMVVWGVSTEDIVTYSAESMGNVTGTFLSSSTGTGGDCSVLIGYGVLASTGAIGACTATTDVAKDHIGSLIELEGT